jgi:hypothetical protein
MKYFRLSLAIGVLTALLATTALAGEMPFPVAAPAPPSADGDMPCPGAAPTDAVTEVALRLIQSALSLF